MGPLQLHIQTSIQTAGFAVMAVHDDEGYSFAYSIGFTELGHPEVIIYGLRTDISHRLMWDMYTLVKSGKTIEPDVPRIDLANLPCTFKRVTAENVREFCCQGVFWYEEQSKPVEYLQLVLPDKDGKMPWNKGYDSYLMRCQKHLWERLQ